MINHPAEGLEEKFISAIRVGINAVVQKDGGYPTDDLTLLMTYLPRARSEGISKVEKLRSLDELHQEMVSEIEVMLKDEARSPTADGSGNTGYHRRGDASLQCSHVWYGRDTRLMDIGEGEEAMVEGVTINLDGMYNYQSEELLN